MVRQDRPVDRLADEISGPGAIGLVDRLDVVERRGHQHRRVAPGRQGADRLAYLEAAHLRHHDVEHDKIRLAGGEQTQRRRTAVGDDDVKVGGLQHLALQNPFHLVVIDDQDERLPCGRRGDHLSGHLA